MRKGLGPRLVLRIYHECFVPQLALGPCANPLHTNPPCPILSPFFWRQGGRPQTRPAIWRDGHRRLIRSIEMDVTEPISPALSSTSDTNKTPLRLLFAGTVFLGSFLLFLVEPIAARATASRPRADRPLSGSPAWSSSRPRFCSAISTRTGCPGTRSGLLHLGLLALAAAAAILWVFRTIAPNHGDRPSHPHRLRRAGRLDRPSVSHALRHQPAPPGMVGAPRNRPDPLSPLCPVQSRLAAGPRPLSHGDRTPPHPSRPAPCLVLRIRALRHSLRHPGRQNPIRVRLPTTPHRRRPFRHARPAQPQDPLGPAPHGRRHAVERQSPAISPPTSPPFRCSGSFPSASISSP